MPSRHHSLRAREYGEVALHPTHGLLCEVLIESVMLMASCMFVCGSLCFFSGLPFQVLEVGELMFMVASMVYVVVGLLEMFELCKSSAQTHESVFSNSSFHEQMAYLISAIIFMTGTLLFWPRLYRGNKAAEETGQTIASRCFVVGSFGFVCAGIWNALSMADSSKEEEAEGGKCWARLTKASLFTSITGAMFFVTGSYLYTLDQQGGCDEFVPSLQKKSGKWCLSVTDNGTILYLVGSILYTIQSIMGCIKVCLKSGGSNNEDPEYFEVSMQDDNDEYDNARSDRDRKSVV